MIVINVKSLFFVLSVIAVFLTSACANGVADSGDKIGSAEPYSLALDELISTDTALNENMEYISLDLDDQLPLKDSDKQSIEEYLQSKYNVKIYNFTYEQLIDEGLYDTEKSTLKGILLKIEKQEQSDKNNVIIEVSKYRTNEGGLSSKITLAYQDGQWKVVNHTPTKES
ncbi:hypothetical protein J28TS4_28000 [Paenibacillus lautus]|uniref:hypothetical protein n=1 Tax=Paenibacillus TaxID=44249 RepID=UPI001B1DF469|nr:hypothetical protein [Paenibacillus lautus]MCI1774085.1 hypothetical protein [Paenibacillus lautus]GIP04393.1 hypothetical protein J28TS4_28000 [Paenibacillus lautus]